MPQSMQLQLRDPEKTRVMESLVPEATNLPFDSRQSRLSFSLFFTSILLPAMDDLSFSTSPIPRALQMRCVPSLPCLEC